MNAKLHELIENQRKGHENEPRWMIGEQLLEIAARESGVSEILERDLEIPELSLEAVEKKFQQYANKHRGHADSFCITPKVADQILREMYGLPGGSVREAPASHGNQIKYHLVVTADPDCEFVKEHFITPPFCGLTKK